MRAPEKPINEKDRLKTLHSLNLLDTPPEERFDRITLIAKSLFDVPISLVSFVDANRQWFKSCIGLNTDHTPRAVSFCGHAILDNEPFIIPDALKDERFFDNPLVTSSPNIRFYAGMPLTMGDGNNIGTLCIMDTKPRHFTKEQISNLKRLGSLAVNEINSKNLSDTIKELQSSLKKEALISSVAGLLASPDKPRASLNSLVRILGEYTQVSRVYIFEDNLGGKETSDVYEWCREGIKPQIDNLQKVPWKNIPFFKKSLEKEGMLFSEDIRKLPKDTYDILKPQGIESIIALPISIGKQIIGFIGFDECEKGRAWSKSEITLLQTVSKMLSGYYQKEKSQEELQQETYRLENIIRGTNVGTWEWNVQTGEVVFNERWANIVGYRLKELEPTTIKTWEKLAVEEDLAKSEELLNAHFDGKTDYYECEARMKHKNGSYIWVLDRGKVATWTSDGKPEWMYGTHQDITDIKDNQIKLIERTEEAERFNRLTVNRELKMIELKQKIHELEEKIRS